MIADASAEAFKKECTNNTCVIDINMHCRYKYQVTVTPMANHVLIKYKTMEYKIARSDKDAYYETVDFLVDAIDTDCDVSLNYDIEYDSYWPDNNEEHCINNLKVTRHGEQVFWREFKREDMQAQIKQYMRSLRFLN